MTSIKTTRRPRNSGARSPLFVQVDPDVKRKLEEMVSATGAPQWAIVEALIGQAEVDTTGRPVWWPDPPVQQEVLDVSA